MPSSGSDSSPSDVCIVLPKIVHGKGGVDLDVGPPCDAVVLVPPSDPFEVLPDAVCHRVL